MVAAEKYIGLWGQISSFCITDRRSGRKNSERIGINTPKTTSFPQDFFFRPLSIKPLECLQATNWTNHYPCKQESSQLLMEVNTQSGIHWADNCHWAAKYVWVLIECWSHTWWDWGVLLYHQLLLFWQIWNLVKHLPILGLYPHRENKMPLSLSHSVSSIRCKECDWTKPSFATLPPPLLKWLQERTLKHLPLKYNPHWLVIPTNLSPPPGSVSQPPPPHTDLSLSEATPFFSFFLRSFWPVNFFGNPTTSAPPVLPNKSGSFGQPTLNWWWCHPLVSVTNNFFRCTPTNDAAGFKESWWSP